jgi:hypothetical protein
MFCFGKPTVFVYLLVIQNGDILALSLGLKEERSSEQTADENIWISERGRIPAAVRRSFAEYDHYNKGE